MPFLHVILDSPATFDLTKQELDIGAITKPYVAIAHCIRAGLCISHALRKWVRITIGFGFLGPLAMTLDPSTIRYLGTDERSILHIILRAQNAYRTPQTKVPYGVTLSDKPALEILTEKCLEDTILLIPGENHTWQETLAKTNRFIMYCPLFEEWNQEAIMKLNPVYYRDESRRDLAILKVVHLLDSIELAMQKD